MKKKDLCVRFCGIAGDGIVTAGKLLSGVCAKLGLDLIVNDNFSAEIRGLGKSTTDIRFSPSGVRSMGDGIDILVALASADSVTELKDLKEGGCVLYEDDGKDHERHDLSGHIPEGIERCPVPLNLLTQQATGSKMGRNLVALGALAYLLDFPRVAFEEALKKLLSKKGERVVDLNTKALQLGYEFTEAHYEPHGSLEVPTTAESKQMITGNQAIAQGALDCGLSFFAGYPITPATTIMEIVARDLPKLGGWMLQAEDEIAALGAVLGGWYSGKRSMTSTSGPGLCLMSEMINMAVMAEIPLVIVNVQRGGPSTGLPTKVEQSDLNISLYGGAGDSPRVVMAPSTCRECYTGIQLAFDLAEKYQTPVIFLSDLFLGQRTVTANVSRHMDRERCTRITPSTEELIDYKRFRVTDNGVSPLLVPGEKGAFYTVTGLEHSESGNPNYESGVHRDMTKKRYRKFDSMLVDLPRAEIFGDEDARIGLTTWGSPFGAVLEGMELARERGIKSKIIRSIMINPQPEAEFRRFFDSCDRIIIPEMNFEGQYAALLKSRYIIRPLQVHLPGVVPVSPAKIAAKIEDVHNELVAEATCPAGV